MDKMQIKVVNKKVVDAVVVGKVWLCGRDAQGDYWYSIRTKNGSVSAMLRLSQDVNLIAMPDDGEEYWGMRRKDKSIQGILSDAQYGKKALHAWDAVASRGTSCGELVQLNYGEECAYINVSRLKEVFGDWRKFRYAGTDSVHPIFVHDKDGDVVGVICPYRCREEEEKK